ncbi:MAG: hypothetical protein ACYC8S_02730 [Minisyncoccota bacterium]
MGQIIQTEAQFGNKDSYGDAILFHGDFRFKIQFKDISAVLNRKDHYGK